MLEETLGSAGTEFPEQKTPKSDFFGDGSVQDRTNSFRGVDGRDDRSVSVPRFAATGSTGIDGFSIVSTRLSTTAQKCVPYSLYCRVGFFCWATFWARQAASAHR